VKSKTFRTEDISNQVNKLMQNNKASISSLIFDDKIVYYRTTSFAAWKSVKEDGGLHAIYREHTD
jgi:hypothetical protein